MISLKPDVAKDISADNTIQINGRSGPFHVKRTAFHPEWGFCYFYGDQNHQFFFYVDVTPDSGLEVKNATTRRLSGGKPQIDRRDVERIERNIVFLLQERNFSLPAVPINEKNVPKRIAFTWGL